MEYGFELLKGDALLAFMDKADQLWGQGNPDRPEYEWGVFHDIAIEVHRQDAKWGPQNRPLIANTWPGREAYREIAADWKAINDQRVKDGQLGWDGILLDEVYEALESDDVDHACEELVQVMAVCAQMILNLRDRGGLV